MSLSTPTADLKIAYTAGTAWDGSPVTLVDLVLTPAGDLALVTGQARLQQDIARWLVTPQGSFPFDPNYGNPLLNLLGRPSLSSGDLYLSMVEHAEEAFMASQAAAVAQGYLALDEQVDHFEGTVVTLGGQPLAGGGTSAPGSVTLTFTVTTKANQQFPVSALF